MTNSPPRLPLERLSVASFRGLRNLELQNLQRINFLVGSGNSGKTSVLEAIACYAAPLDVRAWLRVARFREARENHFYPLQWVEVLRWLFPHEVSAMGQDLHGPIGVAAEGSSQIAELRARCDSYFGTHRVGELKPATGEIDEGADGDEGGEPVLVEGEGWRFRLEALSRQSGEVAQLEFIGWTENATTLPGATGAPNFKCQLLAPYAHRIQSAQLKSLTKTTLEDDKAEVVELLRDLDPMIMGIEILSDASGNRALLALRHRTSGVAPIHVFGDGIRRALMIALAIQQCQGGVLLLDEIEAALHVSAMGKVFPWLERACTRFDVQLFGTTHSLEAIDAVAGFIDSRSVAAFHINGPVGEAKRYSKDMLQRLVHERGLDIR